MTSKASGDAPQPESKSFTRKTDDVYSWRMSYEAWQTFNDLREKGLFYDIDLVSEEGDHFPAHKIVLCTSGHYFMSLFSGRWMSNEQKKINIPGVSSRMLKCLIYFSYTRKVDLESLDAAKEILIVGSHFGVEEMVIKCAKYITDSLCSENCLTIWEFARTYYCRDLEASTFSFILENFRAIANLTEGDSVRTLWDLEARDLQSILENDELNVKDEKLPLRCVLRWAQNASQEVRQKNVYLLVSSIRLGLLKRVFLETCVQTNEIIQQCSETRLLVQHHILLQGMKETLSEDKVTIKKFAGHINQKYIGSSADIKPTLRECEVLHKTSKPRFPREILLAIGGWSGNAPTASTESFDPITRTWSDSNATFPSLLKRPRAYHGVSFLGECLYVVGGFDGQTTYNSCDRYSLTSGKWKKLCGMYHRRCYVGITQLNGQIYAIGGSEGGGEHMRLKSAERYDPAVNVWARLPDMTERRSDAGVCALEGRVYVAGGFTGHQCVFSVEYFDLEDHVWTRLTPMRIPRSGVTVVAYKDRVLALGGFDGNSSRLKSVEAFDPDLSIWTTLPDMITGRSNFAACVLNGKLMVMGGFNGTSTCSNVEYYDDEENSDEFDLEGDVATMLESPEEAIPRESRNDGRMYEGSGNGSGDNDEEFNDGYREVIGGSNSRRNSFQLHREVATGVWRRLPDMKVSRSALNCCVITGFPPPFLRSIVAPPDVVSQSETGTSQQLGAMDRLMALCAQNTRQND